MCIADLDYDLLSYMLDDIQHDDDKIIYLEYDYQREGFINWTYGGYLVLDIYRLLKPWQVFLFMNNKKNYIFPDITGEFLVELYWPEPED